MGEAMSPPIDEILQKATLAEKVSLLAGAGACSTVAVDRLNIPQLNVNLLLSRVPTKTTDCLCRHLTDHMEFVEVVGVSSIR